ncbi:R3H domain-containing protein 2-like [Hordeum vulgare subsp. vulgare]|uniref:R3H domain-containing protein 2-like n=1 Tax=Hordeum vulgare subsp. vulgare TaxID=112509 RepID=UPI001D1A47D0|nr:R3H domain-containing protein 2-like [Hordeum vulgare subsp. vulgare]
MASRREARSNHFAAALLLSASYAAAVDFEYCNKGRHYLVKVSSVEMSPDPVVRGKPATFKISASTDRWLVRREKITLKMKMLQDLVPGCNKVIGKALEKPRERLSLLRMEQDILKFLRDPRQTQFEFQGLPTSYLRLAAHRLALHYFLISIALPDNSLPDGTSSRIILRKTSAECRLPAVRLANIPVNLPQEETGAVATKVAIKKRPQKNHHGGAGEGANSSRGNLQKSVEERKEEYNRVRAQIFNNISGSSSPVDGRPADEVVLPNTLHRSTSLELNPNTRYGELAEATLERSLTSTASSSRSNNRSMIDKEPLVNRGRQGNRVAIFRDRDSDHKDPDYDRSYDRFVPHNMASDCCYLIWGFLCRNKEYLICTMPTFN